MFKKPLSPVYKLSDELTAYKNRLIDIAYKLMLNFKDFFPNIYFKTAIAVFEDILLQLQLLR